PTLMNAGTPYGQLSACFVLPIEDSIDRIFATLSHMALIHKSGGGTGFSFSQIRPAGDLVGGTAGVASGPIPFIRVFDEATNALKQGGKRRGANMGVLASSHPDIMDFIRLKTGEGLANFNLSVGFDREFFEKLERQSDYSLKNPRDSGVWNTISAVDLFESLSKAAWQCGDPGILFLDTVNKGNTVPGLGDIAATNPCGEQPLLSYESCNLGSINLAACIRHGEIDYDLLGSLVSLGVEFLDQVIDVNRFPIPEIRERTLQTRKIGLGVMGLADALLMMEIPYQSREALENTAKIMGFIQREGHAMSEELGRKKGSFPAIDRSVYQGEMRNATVTTVAPTGSLHLIAGVSSGIEPVFSYSFERIINGHHIRFLHPTVKDYIKSLPAGSALLHELQRSGSLANLPVSREIKDLFMTASEIDPLFHVQMQATVQRFVDNAVSKTVNLPEDARLEDVCEIFLLARRLGCKGITIYRYNSKSDQVLSRGCETCRVDAYRE
ncbi:MAG TPA: adenosylcobalamin-dependent ribonucleoside-diphosphate reductase, partial [Methanolinea sp.]|nr:adenosylcobalamin-dependent ribonucleoside-diphosphate reductase [Methanolinea sp.]